MTQANTKTKNVFNAKQAFAEKMQEQILQSLNEEIIPWHNEIDSKLGMQINAVSGKMYQKTNQMFLMMVSRMNGYDDPRWVTFKQAKEQNWFVKKGSKSVPIIFMSVVDRRNQAIITPDSFIGLSVDESQKLKDNAIVKSRLYQVFNGSQINGIPELAPAQNIQFTYEQTKTQSFIETLQKNMGFTLDYEPGTPNAYYIPSIDAIKSAPLEAYQTYEDYAATLLHEIGHASGHESRLNRTLDTEMGSPEYAQEELTAELAASYLSAVTGIKQKESQFENHKAYCQSWYQVIKDDPMFLYNALIDANSAQAYLLEQGAYEIEIPSVPLEVNADTLKATVQIEDYARDVLGFKVVQNGNFKQLAEHDSCILYPNNTFYRFSERAGGDIFNFVMHFENESFKEAYKRVENYFLESGLELQEANEDSVNNNASDKSTKRNRTLVLPDKAKDNQRVIDYLKDQRGISQATIDDLISRGNLYQDTKGNCVFISYENGVPKYGMRRSTYSDFKGDVKGSQASNGFIIDNHASATIFTEGIIDALSLMELVDNPLEYNYVSVNGVAKTHEVFQHYLEVLNVDKASTVDTIITAFDNDEPGHNATDSLIGIIDARYPHFNGEVMTPSGKDFNDDLLNDRTSDVLDEPRFYTELTVEELELFEASKIRLQNILGHRYDKMFDITSIQKDYDSVENIEEQYPLFDGAQIKQLLKMIGDGNSYKEYERAMFAKEYRSEYLEALRYAYELQLSLHERAFEPKIVFGVVKPHEMIDNLIQRIEAKEIGVMGVQQEPKLLFYSVEPDEYGNIPEEYYGIQGHLIEIESVLDDLIELSENYSQEHPYYDPDTGVVLKPHQVIMNGTEVYYEGPLYRFIERYASEADSTHDVSNTFTLDEIKLPEVEVPVEQGKHLREAAQVRYDSEPLRYQSLTIPNSNCIKSFTNNENIVKKAMTFPVGSRYAGYTYAITMDQVQNIDAEKNTLTLQIQEHEQIELIRGARVNGVFETLNTQYVSANDLIKGYRNLDYEPESHQYIRLSEKDITYFKDIVTENDVTFRHALLKETDKLLNNEQGVYVERKHIVELHKASLDLSNESILDVIDTIEKEKQSRIQNFKNPSMQSGLEQSHSMGEGAITDLEMELG